MTDDPATQAPEHNNLTRANITGKVPIIMPRRTAKRKGVKLSSDKKSHVNSLMKRGLISSKSASLNGLGSAKK